MKTEYLLKDGVVTRNTVPIATYDEETGVLGFLPDGGQYQGVTTRKLRSLGFEVTKTIGSDEAAASIEPKENWAIKQGGAPDALDVVDDGPKPDDLPERGMPDAPSVQVSQRVLDPGNKVSGFPDGPDVDKCLGDKDPRFQRWVFATYPKRAEKHYIGRLTIFS